MAEPTFLAGVYRAVVTTAADPVHRGRVEIEVPAVGLVRTWAPMITHTRESFSTPQPGDEVLVAFEAGDIASPFVLGMLWISSRPPTGNGSEQ